MSKEFREFLEKNHDESTQKAMLAWRNELLDQEREKIAQALYTIADGDKGVSAGGLYAAADIVRKRKGTYE